MRTEARGGGWPAPAEAATLGAMSRPSWQSRANALTGVRALSAQIGVLPEVTIGGRVDVRLDSPTGALIGSFEVPLTPESAGFKTYTIDIAPTEATADLVFVFVNEDRSDIPDPVCAVDWIYFSK